MTDDQMHELPPRDKSYAGAVPGIAKRGFPVIRVRRARSDVPHPLRGRVTYEIDGEVVEIQRVREVTTRLSWKDAQEITITLLGVLEIDDE